jgi:chorismate mutase
MTIDELRRRIDELDERLVALLNERAACALEIGKLKHALGQEVYQPDREAEVLHHARACGEQTSGPLSSDAITRLFERIIDEARRIERATVRHKEPQADKQAGIERALELED